MEINADFGTRTLVHAADLEWIASPMPGVHRRMLDRLGNEVARATSIVRYAPGSHFSAHEHTGGEEFLVLEGVFQDEHGDFPVGSYVRNPPTTSHTPSSTLGCTILVKLWQFHLDDRVQVRTDTNSSVLARDSQQPGVSHILLHTDPREIVRIMQIDSDCEFTVDAAGGAELLVLEGSVQESDDLLKVHSWLRIPVGGTLSAKAGLEGARVWVKTNHLRVVSRPKT